MLLEFLDFVPYVPIKSLKFKCLSKLGSMMRQSEAEFDVRESFGAAYLRQMHTTTRREPPSHLRPADALNLPIRVVQLILDHLLQMQIPVRHRVICALLSNVGCFYVHLGQLRANSKFCFREASIIADILASNCEHLSKLELEAFDWNSVPAFTSRKLKYLQTRINSLDDLLDIFSSFPNLDTFYHYHHYSSPNAQEINAFFEELKKTQYAQCLHSIQELGFNFPSRASTDSFPLHVGFKIKMISCFPNLIRLKCELADKTFHVISQVLSAGSIDDTNGVDVTYEEIRAVVGIFSRLKAFKPTYDIYLSIISVLMPNLEKISIREREYNDHLTINLKHIKILTAYFDPEPLESILTQIGFNLVKAVICTNGVLPDMSAIAKNCPNLKSLIMPYLHHADSLFLNPNLNRHDESALDSSYSGENGEQPFRHLTTLVLGGCIDYDVLSYLLRHALDIENVVLYSCEITTDKKLTQFFGINPMRNLRVLHIEEETSSVSMIHFNQLIHPLDNLCHARYLLT